MIRIRDHENRICFAGRCAVVGLEGFSLLLVRVLCRNREPDSEVCTSFERLLDRMDSSWVWWFVNVVEDAGYVASSCFLSNLKNERWGFE